jgi:hypothetical protein
LEENLHTTETTLYPLPGKGDKQTMLQIKTECIKLVHLKSDWHYSLLANQNEPAACWFTAAEVPIVLRRTPDGLPMLKFSTFSLQGAVSAAEMLEFRYTCTELPLDPLRLLLAGENNENDQRSAEILTCWSQLVRNIKHEVAPDQELARALSSTLLRPDKLN